MRETSRSDSVRLEEEFQLGDVNAPHSVDLESSREFAPPEHPIQPGTGNVEEFGRVSKISYFAFPSRFPTSRDHALDITGTGETARSKLMHEARADDPRGVSDPRSARLAALQWASASTLAAVDARMQNRHIPKGFER